jgi:hypothetical protein
MESSILSEVHDTSILGTGLSTDYALISTSLASRNTSASPLVLPRSGLERSDFVLRPVSAVRQSSLDGRLRAKSGSSARPTGRFAEQDAVEAALERRAPLFERMRTQIVALETQKRATRRRRSEPVSGGGREPGGRVAGG